MNASVIYVDKEWIKQSPDVYREKLHLLHPSIITELFKSEHFIKCKYYFIPLTDTIKIAFKTINPTAENIPNRNMSSFLKCAIFFSEATIDEFKSSPYWGQTLSYNFRGIIDQFIPNNVSVCTSLFFTYASFDIIKETIKLKTHITQLDPKYTHIIYRRTDVTMDIVCFLSLYTTPSQFNEYLILINNQYWIPPDLYELLKKNSPDDIVTVEFSDQYKQEIYLLDNFQNIDPKTLNSTELDRLSHHYYYNKPTLKTYIFNNTQLDWNWDFITTSQNTTLQFVLENPQYPWNYKLLSTNKNITEDDIKHHPEIHWVINSYEMNPNIGWNISTFNIHNHYTGFRETYAKKITQNYIHKMMKYIL